MAHLRYFSWVREKIGTPTEEIPLPPEGLTVAGVLDLLKNRDETHATALASPNLRVAVNQTYARPTDAVRDDDEIAIFPPVSGG
ncbi:MAG: molybdopterin converting factor subunit 1 [Magnetococcales bacterium]|nr:molybdopterin converting factor subunit 1 [Magnetococcales bacterium]